MEIFKTSSKIQQKEAKIVVNPLRTGHGLSLFGDKDEFIKVLDDISKNGETIAIEAFFNKKRPNVLIDYDQTFILPIDNVDPNFIQCKSAT